MEDCKASLASSLLLGPPNMETEILSKNVKLYIYIYQNHHCCVISKATGAYFYVICYKIRALKSAEVKQCKRCYTGPDKDDLTHSLPAIFRILRTIRRYRL
jgi:hypothetical protein